MAHMQRQIVKGSWLKVETTYGTEFVSIADTSLFVRDSHTLTHPMTPEEKHAAVTKIQPYTEGEPQEWENITGYGARLSAPGYLDCTPWEVFESEQEALDYLAENDPQDEDAS